MRRVTILFCLGVWQILFVCPCNGADKHLEFGFSRVEITPTVPLRLSGYGSRTEPSTGVDEPLHARVMALRNSANGALHVLVSVDTIGLPGTLTASIHRRVQAKHKIPRERLALCCTHAHTTPVIAEGLTNLFSVPLSQEQLSAVETYTGMVADRIVDAVDAAIADLRPGRMFQSVGQVRFASNRRVIQNGVWKGFGVNPDGPVDHSLPILRITDVSGNTVRGLIFNYACHCTTFGPRHNQVNSDWAGYAARLLEQAHPEATALCTIGCGGDQNPGEGPQAEDPLTASRKYGREIADEVQRLIRQGGREITEPPSSSFGLAGLPIDRPTLDELRKNLKEGSTPQLRRHAENMLEIHRQMGRLPESYPMPVQVWRFGSQFAMVLLGGEVCVDYAHRIKEELAPSLEGKAADGVWVTAYVNDVFGYVASERMRQSGGYEVDYSMVFYNHPGRWSSGTEETILKQVHERFKDAAGGGALSPQAALGTFTLPAGYTIDLIASEPLIADPVNFSLGPDGRLWVVEMGDYPNGKSGTSAEDGSSHGGRIKVLTDTDRDGLYDASVTFVDGLAFPNGVIPWRDGAILSVAPDILFLRDTDGDGRADERQVLYTGFAEGNPQHRVNGFVYGLDHWLYLAGGGKNGKITSLKTGEQVDVAGRDVRIQPDLGLIEPVSGLSQYGRTRDDWGNWFGNSNSQPLYHFVIEDRYLRRNPHVALPLPLKHLTSSNPPRVYPTSRTLDRFNDLFTLNRFTSACSPQIIRDPLLGANLDGAALVCEPVHNLVSRILLRPEGVTFDGARLESETESEFLSSTDNWFRPVNLMTAPDGSLWICDMYRLVIEHPEWIPQAWQAALDLYAGHNAGRIYRVRRTEVTPRPVPDFTQLDSTGLIRELSSRNGWRRDMAQRLLIERQILTTVPALEAMCRSAESPHVRLQALATLSGLQSLSQTTLTAALADPDPHVVRWAAACCESLFVEQPALVDSLISLRNHTDPLVRLQVALSLGESERPDVARPLLELLLHHPNDPWVSAAVLTSSRRHAMVMVQTLLADPEQITSRQQLLAPLIATALGEDPGRMGALLATEIARAASGDVPADWQFTALSACLDGCRRRNVKWNDVLLAAGNESQTRIEGLIRAARELALDESAPLERRINALPLLGYEPACREADIDQLYDLLAPRSAPELQVAVIHGLANLRPENLPEKLLRDWRRQGPAVRTQMTTILLSRQNWTESFLDALESAVISPAEIDATTRARLLGHARPALRARAQRLFGDSGSSKRQQIVAAYRPAGELQGDAARGTALFQKQCANCHRHGTIGRDVGPRLSTLSDKSSEFLLTAILDPNRAIEQKYRGYNVSTQDGRVFNGIIQSETANGLTLVGANGREEMILRIDIEELASTGSSLMPEGLEKELSHQDLADLMEFIRIPDMRP